jgi:hypothetical protein
MPALAKLRETMSLKFSLLFKPGLNNALVRLGMMLFDKSIELTFSENHVVVLMIKSRGKLYLAITQKTGRRYLKSLRHDSLKMSIQLIYRTTSYPILLEHYSILV